MAKEANPFERKDFKGEVLEEYSGLTEDQADHEVLEQLRQRGSNLSLPRHIIHHLYFPLSDRREAAEPAVRQHGYDVGIPDEDESEDAHLLRAERTGIADEASIRNDRIILSGIAKEHDGWYDGWAAAED